MKFIRTRQHLVADDLALMIPRTVVMCYNCFRARLVTPSELIRSYWNDVFRPFG